MTDCDPLPGATVPPDGPRYATLVRGFNQRWVRQPELVQVCGDAEQVRETVQDCVERGRRITSAVAGTATRTSSPATTAASSSTSPRSTGCTGTR